jgi:dihydroorotate dehydrogenase (NAD+) catalytic subunit
LFIEKVIFLRDLSLDKTLLRKLETSIAGLRLDHPVMNASGVLGAEPEQIEILASYGVSAIVSKTITKNPRRGYDPPIVVELRNGDLLNAVGLANPGINIIPELIKKAKSLGKRIIISVGGSSEKEFAEVAEKAEISGADAVELNLSCPHTKGYGIDIGGDPSNVAEVVETVSSIIKIPVIAKLGLSDRIRESAGKALEKGARALTLINTIKAMAIDVYSKKPILTNIVGGLSGRSIHPVATRVIYEIYGEYGADIIGVGGVFTWEDAAEFILAGARAIQVGTALIKDPGVIHEILKGLIHWLETLETDRIEDLIGAAHRL